MIACTINGISFQMDTDHSLFSPNHMDKGTLAMVSNVEFQPGQKVLDLGCGYGAVGIYAAHVTGAENVTMTDIDPLAVVFAKRNAEYNSLPGIHVFQSDGLASVTEREFDLILSNPPYHADFSVPKKFIEEGFRHLKYGGSMVMVTKRYGWYKNKLKSVFGGVKVIEENGYFVFVSQKRKVYKTRVSGKPELSRKLRRKYR
ncbi:MAG: methyltransferase [Lachnospiraceae bacterium]|nr:methyltransferase [Lachnospiraceae bacterium]